MGKTIWVVEQGSYSDYHVVGVFTNRENAEIITNKINGAEYVSDRATLAEWPLDPAVKELNSGLKLFNVLMRQNGDVEQVEEREFSSYSMNEGSRLWQREDAPAYRGNPNKPNVLDATVYAKSKKHAVKIANEIRARMIADGEWK